MNEAILELKRRYPEAETFVFGDGPDLCAHLISLVREGHKTATTSALRDIEAGTPLPAPGCVSIALTWTGQPALVIETLEVRHTRFCEVTEVMALAEGEDDSLESWRAGHRAFFHRNGGFSPELEVIWERFRLIEDLGGET